MTTNTKPLTSSVLDPENYKQLKTARFILQEIKDFKLQSRNLKNRGHSWTPGVILNHLDDEVRELKAALVSLEYSKAIRELADISNMVDILLLAILNEDLSCR